MAAMKFGYYKGRTFDRVMIYSTKPIFKWLYGYNGILKERKG